MKSFCPKSTARVGVLVASVVLLVLTSALPVNAQRGAPVPATGRPGAPGVPSPGRGSVPTPPSIREREFIIRGMENERNKTPTPEQTRLALAQIAEDYERIQVINNKMMSAATSGKPLDYKGVADVTTEIRKRALRLKSNIALPKPEEADKNQKVANVETGEQLVAALRLLDRALMNFVKSPIFKNPDVVDAKIAAKASRDLENVIELSQNASKNAEKLDKAASKP
jgi:hypothetical protein